MVIKRKLRNSTANTSTPVPEAKPEEKTPSPTPPVKVERRGRPRKSDNASEEIINDRPVKASRPNETFKIIPFNPKGAAGSSKGKEKETVHSPTELSSEPNYSESTQQFDSGFATHSEAPVYSPLPQQQTHTKSSKGDSSYSDQVPLYAIRYISKPIQICFPKRLPSFANQIHHNNFSQLTAQVVIFQKNDLWDEANILERLYYKNKNQHKRAGYFRKIIETRKILKRIKEIKINKFMSEFIGAFYSTKVDKIQSTWDQVDQVPSQEMVIFVMNRLIGMVLLMNKALDTFRDTFKIFNTLLRQTEFMSFALACLAIISRLNILTHVFLEEIKKCYGLLRNWVEYFPRSSQTGLGTDFDNEIDKLPKYL